MRRPPATASRGTSTSTNSSSLDGSGGGIAAAASLRSTSSSSPSTATTQKKQRSTQRSSKQKQAGRQHGVTRRGAMIILGMSMLLLLLLLMAWTVSSLLGMLGSFVFDTSFQPGKQKHRQVSILEMDRHRREQHQQVQRQQQPQQLSEKTVVSLERDLWTMGNDTTTTASFCALWSVNVDAWWTHQPTWELTQQNTTHQCFRRIPNTRQRQLYQRLYAIQFPSSSSTCPQTTVLTKHCTGSGWGVDVSHMVDGLQMALSSAELVLILTPLPWQYAGGCPRADASCYFLPFSICDAEPREALPPGQQQRPQIRYQQPWRGFAPRAIVPDQQRDKNDKDDDDDLANEDGSLDWTVPWLLQYATRAQTWLRHRVVQAAVEHLVGLSSSFNQQPQQSLSPCIAMHVRRADVVLHGKFSRRYHAIREYVHALEQHYYDWGNRTHTHNILLLTDDANAIQEAWTEYPPNPRSSNHNNNNNIKHNIQWFYLDRPRHQADEGGWENQIPSGDAVTDVVLLLAAVELAALHCHTLVHSKSNLADYLYASMLLAAAARKQQPQQEASEDTLYTTDLAVERIDLDANQPHQAIHRAANAESVRISTAFG